jgi:hypothetical protein
MRAILLVLVVALAPLVGAVGAVTTAPADATAASDVLGLSDGANAMGDDAAEAQTRKQNSSANATLGASISSFMQASSANAEDEVDNRMFTAAFENTNPKNRDKLIEKRASQLQKRIDRLQEQRAELLADGELTVAERAKAARLQARISGLDRAIDSATEAAEWAGVDTAGLNTLRRNARDLSGPEVAAIATGLGDTAPGRSGDVPGQDDAEATNGTDAPGKSGEAPGQSEDKKATDDLPLEANVTDVSTGSGTDPAEDAVNGSETGDGPSAPETDVVSETV